MGHLGDLSAFSQKFLKNSSNFFPLGVLGVTFPFVQKALGQHKALPLVKKSQKKFLPKMRFFEAHTHFEGFYVKIFQKFFGKFFDLAQIVLTKIGFGDLLFAHPETIKSKPII